MALREENRRLKELSNCQEKLIEQLKVNTIHNEVKSFESTPIRSIIMENQILTKSEKQYFVREQDVAGVHTEDTLKNEEADPQNYKQKSTMLRDEIKALSDEILSLHKNLNEAITKKRDEIEGII